VKPVQPGCLRFFCILNGTLGSDDCSFHKNSTRAPPWTRRTQNSRTQKRKPATGHTGIRQSSPSALAHPRHGGLRAHPRLHLATNRRAGLWTFPPPALVDSAVAHFGNTFHRTNPVPIPIHYQPYREHHSKMLQLQTIQSTQSSHIHRRCHLH